MIKEVAEEMACTITVSRAVATNMSTPRKVVELRYSFGKRARPEGAGTSLLIMKAA